PSPARVAGDLARDLGEGRREAPDPPDAAAAPAAARSRADGRGSALARERAAGAGSATATQPGTRDRAAPEPNRIRQHGPRSSRREPAARRRLPPRRRRLRLRQHRRRALRLARPPPEGPPGARERVARRPLALR